MKKRRGNSLKTLYFKAVFISFFLVPFVVSSNTTSDLTKELNDFVNEIDSNESTPIGFPGNQNIDLKEFYEWYVNSKIFDKALLNNASNPRIKDNPYLFNTHKFENEVIDFFSLLCGFDIKNSWGIVTFSGTDGNNHGIYFGAKHHQAQTKIRPIVYVSDDAHYSVKRIADLQNLELKIIPTDLMGRMQISEFEKQLDPNKPAIIVISLGTTFKGAMDDQEAIDKVLAKKTPIGVYRHLDAALFGGYLLFLKDIKPVISNKLMHFDSISISGHKFFGFDEPVGIFITTNDILANQNPFHVSYLNDAVPTISCSRSGLAALKFWWKIKKNSFEDFSDQAETIMSLSQYLKNELDSINYPVWINPYSNIIIFKRPNETIMKKWSLAPGYDELLGGNVAHAVVMQHVTKETIDLFICDLKKEVDDSE